MYGLNELCYRCYSIRVRYGDKTDHRACFEPGCFCWCSLVTAHFA